MFRNGLYNIAGQAVRGAVSLLSIPFLVRLLGLREYGVWSLAFAVLSLMVLGEGGIPVAATFFLSKDLALDDSKEEVSKTATILITAAVLFSGLLVLLLWFAGPLIVHLLGAFDTADRATAGKTLQIAGPAIAALVLQRTFVGFEQAFDKYAVASLLDVLQSVLSTVGLVAVAWFGGKSVALMKWQVITSSLPLAIHVCVVAQLLRVRWAGFEWSADKASEIVRYSAAAWSSAIGSAAFNQCDQLVVGGVLGAATLGIYSAITSLCSRINSFSGAAVQPLVPSLSRAAASGTRCDGRVRQAIQLNASIATAAGVALYMLAHWVVRVMFPAATLRETGLCLQAAAIIYAIYSLNAPGYYILFSIGRARTNAVIVLGCGLASLGLIFFGAHFFGLRGAIVGNAGYIATLFLTFSALKNTGTSMRQYLAWNAFPFSWFALGLVTGASLADYQLLRILFVMIQLGAFVAWFVYHRNRIELEFHHV